MTNAAAINIPLYNEVRYKSGKTYRVIAVHVAEQRFNDDAWKWEFSTNPFPVYQLVCRNADGQGPRRVLKASDCTLVSGGAL